LEADHNGQGSARTKQDTLSEVADLRQVAATNGTPTRSLARELHLVQARASELEIRVAELGACLVDAEQRAAELPSARAQLEERELELDRSEAAREEAEHWLAHLNASASWRLTAPLRRVKTRARALIGRS
jgi:uncharacterized protein (DUF3084 family)